eukprot:UN01139
MAQQSTINEDTNDNIMGFKEESRLRELSRHAVTARASIAQELGPIAGATVDSVRYILEEILSYRFDTMRKNLIEQNQNDKYFKKELQQKIATIDKQSLVINDGNDKLKRQMLERSIQNAKERNANSKLNTITLQNLKTLALLKKIYQRQMDMDTNGAGTDYDDCNLLKKYKLENVELKAQLKQTQVHIKYLEESKINTIMTMSQEIQKLRQQIIDLSKSTPSAPPTHRLMIVFFA